jgi:large conductance mechanosensitive channel
MWQEFKDFIMRGNVIDLAVGIVIGGAFNQIVSSLVSDVIMPPVGLLLSGVNFSELYLNLSGGEYDSLAAAQEAGAATINYGVFLNTIIDFVIIAFVIFVLIRWVNRLHKDEAEEAPAEPTAKDCPYCHTEIPIAAVRCPNCTSQLEAAPA